MAETARAVADWSGDALVGRATELAAIATLLEAPGLVTLVGPGGAGKTSLALAIAGREGPSRPGEAHSAVTIDLAPISDARSIPATVATSLGAREAGDGDLQAAIAERLASPTLLVLDNMEHLLGAAPFVAWLAANAGPSRVLVTSRQPLGVSGERLVAVEPLAVPSGADEVSDAPASRLFLRRAHTEAASLGSDDLQAVASICRRVDGLPLAIELAAAWIDLLSPRAIDRRIATNLLPLEDGRAGRHANLEHVIEASLELLEPPDRQAFDLLAVFGGPFGDEAAAAVVGSAALRHLRALARLSLLSVVTDAAGEPRFRMLETIRAVARTRLERVPAAAAAARHRHAVFYEHVAAAAAEQLRARTFGDPDSLRALGDPNLEVAYDASVAAGDVVVALGLAVWPASRAVRTGILTPNIQRIERTLALGPVPESLRADALNAIVSMRNNRGDKGLVELARQTVDAARAGGNPRQVSRALVTLGNELPSAEAVPVLEDAARVATAAGYHWMIGTAEANLAGRLQDLGRWADAITANERAARAYEIAGSPVGVANVRSAIGDVYVAMGRDDAAASAYRDALPGLRGDVPVQFLSPSLSGLAILAARSRHTHAALDHLLDLVAAIGAMGETENHAAANDLAVTVAIVLAGSHPIIAAHALDLIDPAATIAAFRPDVEAARSAIERRLGAVATTRAVAAGRRGGLAALVAEVRRLAATEGPDARARLRAAYEAFTPREEEVLRLLADGRSDPEIAAELGMSAKTASVHVANIKAKLGLETRVEAALQARRMLDALG